MQDPVCGAYGSSVSEGASPETLQQFGKPFKIVWVSTERLPFFIREDCATPGMATDR